MSELVMRKIDGKMKLFKKTVKKSEEKGEKHDSAKEEKAEQKEHKEHPEFSKKTTDQIAHDHIEEGKGCGKGGGQAKDDPGENSRAYHTESMTGRESRYGKKEKMGKGGGGGVRHGKKAKKLSFAAYSAKKWEKK